MKSILLSLALLFGMSSYGQITDYLGHEMVRMDVNTALIWNSSAIDYHPVWSPDSKKIAINLMSKHWIEIDLEESFLIGADWLDQVIGTSQSETMSLIEDTNVIVEYSAATRYAPRLITTSDHKTIELRMNGFQTEFVVNKKVLWRTGGDNCHSLALSPDEKFVAYISEGNGLMVYALDLKTLKKEMPKEVHVLHEIQEVLNKGNLEKGTKMTEELIQKYPSYDAPHFIMAVLNVNVDNEESLKHADKAIELRPEFANHYYLKSTLLLMMHRHEDAIPVLNDYIKHKPNCLFGYYILGEVYADLGEPEKACEQFKLAKKYLSSRADEKIKEHCGEGN